MDYYTLDAVGVLVYLFDILPERAAVLA